MPPPKEIIPAGVTLRDFDDFNSARAEIFDGVKSEVSQAFPIEYGNFKMELEELDYEDPETYGPDKQKDARLRDQSLARRLRGTVVLRSKDGAELERKRLTLMRVPYLTERGTFVRGGNDYSFANQLRLLPGVFTRVQQNGELESQFNVRAGTGSNFRVALAPESQQFHMDVRDSKLHLYSLLHDLGTADAALERMWGKEILENNRQKYDVKVLDKAYTKLVARWEQQEGLSREEKTEAVRAALDRAQIHERTARRNLPSMFDREKAAAWRREAAHMKDAPFEPDFSPQDLAKVFPDGLNDWQRWYTDYVAGARSSSDAQRIREWNWATRGLREKFAARPSLGRYFELQKFAMNGLLTLPEAQRDVVFNRLVSAEKIARAHIKLAAFSERELESIAHYLITTAGARIDPQADPQEVERAILEHVQNSSSILPQEIGALPSVRTFAPAEFETAPEVKSASEGGRGCLMVRVPIYTAARISEWVQQKVPQESLAGSGYEHEVHVTVAYGFAQDVTAEDIRAALKEWGAARIDFMCEKITRFNGKGQDVLKVDVESKDLRDLNTALRAHFGERLKISFPDYHPHMTLAYVKPGALAELDDHCRFEGDVFTTAVLIFSVAGSKTKTYIRLDELA